MMPYLTNNFANANSTHKFGVASYEAVKAARVQVANILGAETNEIVFTSGATEAINLAIKGVAENYASKGKHIITVATEHSAVLDTCKYLEGKGIEVTYLPVQPDGLIDLTLFQSTLREDTILVSVMYVNNETGVIQPIKEIAELTHRAGALFMSDCTQAVGKLPVHVDELGIDLLCFSGHKIYAPKGVGALFVRQRQNRVKLPALAHGGGHERGLRSGTLNVPGIIGLGITCELAEKEMQQNTQHISAMRDYLEQELLKIEGTSVNGNTSKRLYNVTNIQFEGVDSDALIMGLSDLTGAIEMIAVSNGSACTSTSIDPSHVLTAMGMNENQAFNSVRFSLGKFNTSEEMKTVVTEINTCILGLRALSF
jgi:cysteine desulfurase